MPTNGFFLGVDIGGTFTDLVLVRPHRPGPDDPDSIGSPAVLLHKTLTTPDDPTIGLFRGVDEILALAGIGVADLTAVVHSTTLVTNAILERTGERVGLLVTRGFADQLELRTEQRYDIHDMALTYPPPLVERALRREVDERTLADGRSLEAPRREQVLEAADALLAGGARSLALVLLHAYRAPTHEERIHGWLRQRHPDLPISVSSRVAPIMGEYVRMSTTVADAAVKPRVDGYLRRLEVGLATRAFRGVLSVILSSGVAGAVGTARAYPIRMVESGPAAGAIAAAAYGRALDLPDLLAFDMGGTTAKACLIEDGAPTVAREIEVARVRRFTWGSGLPLAAPSVELLEIGAGGGSVARVSPLGLLEVGPDSAGADPGPACYGLGGRAATVTDADLLLGYLDPDHFLGGRMRLDPVRAETAVAALGERLGLSPLDAAWGIRRVVDETMAQAARAHLIEHNRDPRSLRVVAFGGAGPVHAASVARRLGAAGAICPLGAGVTSALGGLAAPVAFSVVRSFPTQLDCTDWDALNALLDAMADEALAALVAAGHGRESATVERQAEVRLAGQLHVVDVPIPTERLGPDDAAEIRDRFREAYVRRYGRFGEGYAVECVAWRVDARVPPPPMAMPRGAAVPTAAPAGARTGTRRAWFERSAGADGADGVSAPSARGGFLDAAVYDRHRLGPGSTIVGPAILQEPESAVVLGPRDRGRVDDAWNLWIDWVEER